MLYLQIQQSYIGEKMLHLVCRTSRKCKLSACRLSNLEEAELTSHARNNTQGTPVLQPQLVWDRIMVSGAICPTFDLQIFDSELCDVVKAAYYSVRGSATSDFYDAIWAAEDAAKAADRSASGCPLEALEVCMSQLWGTLWYLFIDFSKN